jgi:colanic acid/amylovoran biosynthesis glycosyltransferase
MERHVGHYVSHFLPITEVWLYNLIRNHREYTPVVLNRRIQNPDLFPLENVYSLEKLPVHKRAYNFAFFKSAGYFPYFKNICVQKHCELLHAHFGHNAYKTIGLARVQKKPLVCSFYGVDVYKYPMKPENKARYRALFGAFSKGIVLGPYMKQSLIELGCPEEKLVINHLGVEVDRIEYRARSYPKDRPFRFLMASSFIEKKGIDIALRALKIVEKETDCIVEIIGDGPLRADILALIHELGIDKRVVLHGHKPYSFFLNLAYSCDAFMQASRTAADNDKEGTPMAIIDAMATGLPVVSTYHSDIPEIVDDGATGFLAIENDTDSLCDAIRRLMDRSGDLQTMSQNCRGKIEKEFDIRTQVDKLERLYGSVT